MSEPARPAIILVSPKEAGNVGAAARAMKNFGLRDLRVVAPRCKLERAHVMAVHAQDLIDQARVYDTLLDAVRDHDLVIATTARARRDHAAPIAPRDAAPRVSAARAPAVVFGREESGLTNDELDLAHVHVRIPTDGEYASLNLAQAVLLVAYELMLDRGTHAPTAAPAAQPAPRAALEGMYAHLLEFMLEIGYTDAPRQAHILRRFRQILDRAALDEGDVNLVRGLLAQGLWASRKRRGLDTPGTVPWPRTPAEADP